MYHVKWSAYHMADMRSCYEASVATRGAETQIFINENEHTGCEGNVL